MDDISKIVKKQNVGFTMIDEKFDFCLSKLENKFNIKKNKPVIVNEESANVKKEYFNCFFSKMNVDYDFDDNEIHSYFEIYSLESKLSENKEYLEYFLNSLSNYLNNNYDLTKKIFLNIVHKDVIVPICYKLLELKKSGFSIKEDDLNEILDNNVFTNNIKK